MKKICYAVLVLAVLTVGVFLGRMSVLSGGAAVTASGNGSVFPEAVLDLSQKTAEESALININTADKDELMCLPGIGESKADGILEYRRKNGAFQSEDELKAVNGIGDGMLDKIRNYITVKDE